MDAGSRAESFWEWLHKEEVAPALILWAIRERGPIQAEQLLSACGIRAVTAPRNIQRLRRVREILDGLIDAGLVRGEGDPSGLAESRAREPSPLQGVPGMQGFDLDRRFVVTPAVASLQAALEWSLSELVESQVQAGRGRVAAWEEPPQASDEPGHLLRALAAELDAALPTSVYRQDLIESLVQMGKCLDIGCNIAVLAIAGKVLEISLKKVLIEHRISFDDTWGLGKLLGRYGDECRESGYLDPGIKGIAHIINESRIPAVHAKRDIPIPSRDQAMMVMHATVDTVRRLLLRTATKS